MNKAELISAIASQAVITKIDAKKAVDAFIAVAGESLKTGDKITLVGFGTFSVSERSERKGRNPRTGQQVNIPAKKAVKFKAGSELTEMIK